MPLCAAFVSGHFFFLIMSMATALQMGDKKELTQKAQWLALVLRSGLSKLITISLHRLSPHHHMLIAKAYLVR